MREDAMVKRFSRSKAGRKVAEAGPAGRALCTPSKPQAVTASHARTREGARAHARALARKEPSHPKRYPPSSSWAATADAKTRHRGITDEEQEDPGLPAQGLHRGQLRGPHPRPAAKQ